MRVAYDNCTRLLRYLILLATLFCGMASAAQNRSQPPGDAEVEAIQATVEKVLGAAVADESLAAAKVAVVDWIVSAARRSKEKPVQQYALLRRALSLAAEAGDAEAAMEVVDEINKHFLGDEIKIARSALVSVNRNVRTTSQRKKLVQQCVETMKKAIAQQRLVESQYLGSMAVTAARRARNFPLAASVGASMEQIEKQLQAKGKYRLALETLQADESDVRANLTVARYLCFAKGDWKAGLPYLRSTRIKEFVELADLETAGPQEPEAQIALADAWWQFSQRAVDPDRRGSLVRAEWWYRAAAAQPLSGPAKARVQQRLGELKVLGLTVPGSQAAAAK